MTIMPPNLHSLHQFCRVLVHVLLDLVSCRINIDSCAMSYGAGPSPTSANQGQFHVNKPGQKGT